MTWCGCQNVIEIGEILTLIIEIIGRDEETVVAFSYETPAIG